MSLIKKPHELQPKQKVKMLIYGQPGSGKTTLALSAIKPLLLDFENGLQRVQGQFQVTSVPVNTYQDIIDVLANEDLSDFDTIVIDTLGKLIDSIQAFVLNQNKSLMSSQGTMKITGWGIIKQIFSELIKQINQLNKSLVIVAHAKEERKGDSVLIRLDCSGSAKDEIIKEMDLVGYLFLRNNSRVISFAPNEEYYAKNSMQLNDEIAVPNPEKVKTGNDFIAKNIQEQIHIKATQKLEQSALYSSLINMIESNIAELASVEDVNLFYSNKITHIWDSELRMKHLLNEKVKQLNITFNKETKLFGSKENVISDTKPAE